MLLLKSKCFFNVDCGSKHMPGLSAFLSNGALLSPQYPLVYGLVLIPCWSSLVCLSRMYMGMHSLLVRNASSPAFSTDVYEP